MLSCLATLTFPLLYSGRQCQAAHWASAHKGECSEKADQALTKLINTQWGGNANRVKNYIDDDILQTMWAQATLANLPNPPPPPIAAMSTLAKLLRKPGKGSKHPLFHDARLRLLAFTAYAMGVMEDKASSMALIESVLAELQDFISGNHDSYWK